MGWKDKHQKVEKPNFKLPQSAFAGCRLEAMMTVVKHLLNLCRNPLSLDMGWKTRMALAKRRSNRCRNPLSLDMGWKDKAEALTVTEFLERSQSAFAGYGLEGKLPQSAKIVRTRRNPLSLDMGWKHRLNTSAWFGWWCRNPLSLDMGWKNNQTIGGGENVKTSQSAFAGYGLEVQKGYAEHFNIMSQSAFAGYGLKGLT